MELNPVKLFGEQSNAPVLVASTMIQRQNTSGDIILKPRQLLQPDMSVPGKGGDLIEIGGELETHFNNESNINFIQEATVNNSEFDLYKSGLLF